MKSLPFYLFGLFLVTALACTKYGKEEVAEPAKFTELKRMPASSRPIVDGYLPTECSSFKTVWDGVTWLHFDQSTLDAYTIQYNFPNFTGSGFDLDGSNGIGYADYTFATPSVNAPIPHNVTPDCISVNFAASTQLFVTLLCDVMVNGIMVAPEGSMAFVSFSSGDELFYPDGDPWLPYRTWHLILPGTGVTIYFGKQ